MKLNEKILVLLLAVVFGFTIPDGDFKTEQKRYNRVRGPTVKKKLRWYGCLLPRVWRGSPLNYT